MVSNKRVPTVFVVAVVAGIAAGVLAAMAGGLLFQEYRTAIEVPYGHVLSDFALIDQDGNPFVFSSLKRKSRHDLLRLHPLPRCPSTVLSKYKQTIEQLGPEADKVAFFFVTIDPERDTPEVMKELVSKLFKLVWNMFFGVQRGF